MLSNIGFILFCGFLGGFCWWIDNRYGHTDQSE